MKTDEAYHTLYIVNLLGGSTQMSLLHAHGIRFVLLVSQAQQRHLSFHCKMDETPLAHNARVSYCSGNHRASARCGHGMV